MTPAEAREVLRAAIDQVMPEERGPLWDTWPWTRHRVAIETRAAGYAAHTRREHLTRLIALSDGQLARLMADGWDPRDRGRRLTRQRHRR